MGPEPDRGAEDLGKPVERSGSQTEAYGNRGLAAIRWDQSPWYLSSALEQPIPEVTQPPVASTVRWGEALYQSCELLGPWWLQKDLRGTGGAAENSYLDLAELLQSYLFVAPAQPGRNPGAKPVP
jgi:hypothetical protein